LKPVIFGRIDYIHHLTKVIGTNGRYGNAIILAGVANFVLPQQDTFTYGSSRRRT
jgi:hypothetical protein